MLFSLNGLRISHFQDLMFDNAGMGALPLFRVHHSMSLFIFLNYEIMYKFTFLFIASNRETASSGLRESRYTLMHSNNILRSGA